MKIIGPSAQLISEKDPCRKIEIAGRTCYMSQDKISDESAEKFTKGLIKSGHTAMVEHQVFTFVIPKNSIDASYYGIFLKGHRFANVSSRDDCYIVSMNVREIFERGVNDPIMRAVKEKYPQIAYGKGLEEPELYSGITARIVDLKDLTPGEILKHCHLTFRLVTNIGASRELIRHRLCSFAEQSTRYCNYSKDKFGSELTFVRPADYDEWPDAKKRINEIQLEQCEKAYLALTTGEDPLQPQQARDILPLSLKTEIVVTASLDEWIHIFNLRVYGRSGAPHPDIQEVLKMALDEAKKDPIAARVL